MKRAPQGRYTREFRQEAVKLVLEENLSLPEAGRRLSLPPSTLGYWEKLYKAGKLGDVDKSYRPLTDVEMELARTKKELAEVKMERDILKKAAAYFARESLPGTRGAYGFIASSGDADSGTGKNARKIFTLPSENQTGTYWLRVIEGGNDATGTYRLRVREVVGSGYGRTFPIDGRLTPGGTLSGTLPVHDGYFGEPALLRPGRPGGRALHPVLQHGRHRFHPYLAAEARL